MSRTDIVQPRIRRFQKMLDAAVPTRKMCRIPRATSVPATAVKMLVVVRLVSTPMVAISISPTVKVPTLINVRTL
jgi:hypothetical protein